MKTASRIVGTGAFLEGHQVQDSPVYGAERRGAPVTSFTRIDGESILERGAISQPDLIVVADRTLLEDAGAHVLAGQEAASTVFVNAASREGFEEVKPQLIVHDLTSPTVRALGRASALSAGLGAAAARLSGRVSEGNMVAALREELGSLRLGPEEIARNEELAREVFGALPVVEIAGKPLETAAVLHRVGYDGPRIGSPSIFTAGNAELRRTGSWRVERPEIDYDRCIRCGLCFVRCPDGAIALDENGYPVIDYDHCKGCMICRQICPVAGGIESHKETEAW